MQERIAVPLAPSIRIILGESSNGLLRLNVLFDQLKSWAGRILRLELSLSGTSDFSWSESFVCDPQEKLKTVIMHRFLLSNGQYTITAYLFNGSTLIQKAGARIQVDNEIDGSNLHRSSALQTPLFVAEGRLDSRHYSYDRSEVIPWFDGKGASQTLHEQGHLKGLKESEIENLRNFINEGFISLPNLIGPELLAKVKSEISDAAERAEISQDRSGQRLEGLHHQYEGIREIWLFPEILRWLELIFGQRAAPCQTLVFPYGSEQHYHQDTIHLTPFPAGYMCGVWVAIEDVQEGAGELIFYPGSHRLPRIYMADVGCSKVRNGDWSEFDRKVVSRWRQLIDESGIQPVKYQPKKGDVLIWHENLIHGGLARMDKSLSRYSVVSHYFSESAISYYDSTGNAGFTQKL